MRPNICHCDVTASYSGAHQCSPSLLLQCAGLLLDAGQWRRMLLRRAATLAPHQSPIVRIRLRRKSSCVRWLYIYTMEPCGHVIPISGQLDHSPTSTMANSRRGDTLLIWLTGYSMHNAHLNYQRQNQRVCRKGKWQIAEWVPFCVVYVWIFATSSQALCLILKFISRQIYPFFALPINSKQKHNM